MVCLSISKGQWQQVVSGQWPHGTAASGEGQGGLYFIILVGNLARQSLVRFLWSLVCVTCMNVHLASCLHIMDCGGGGGGPCPPVIIAFSLHQRKASSFLPMSEATQGLEVIGSIIMFLMKMNTDSISQDLRRFDRGFCTCVSQRATRRRWHIGLDSFVAAAAASYCATQSFALNQRLRRRRLLLLSRARA